MADLSSTKVFGKLTVIHDAILKANAEITGNVNVTGTITGDGSGLTILNATNLASGTVAEARLPASALIGDTTYTAGAGITLTGTTFALTDESYTTTEKTKLSGIETGATADQTASEILTSIKTVDGSTSGLDADLLDGQHASAFALDGHTHNYDNYGGWTLLTDGTSRGSITSGENVNLVGGTNVSLSYSATNNTITVSSTDTNTDTTYTAGTGLTLTGTSFALTDESYTTTEKNKLAGIESGATGDQTASEIKTAYESNLDTNAFTDALQTKLNGIAAGADDYSSWTISDGTNNEAILSGNTLTVTGSGATSAVYNNTTNTLTISSTDTNTTYTAGTGLTLTGTTFSLTNEAYTSTEKTKLSGIESGATADQTAGEILTAIKTVDGSTSGLDADLLDGNHASAFAPSSHSHLAGDLPATIMYEGENISLLNNNSGYIADAPSDGTQYARLDGTWSAVSGGSSFVSVSNNTTAANGDAFLCDTSTASFTVTLPATPTLGDKVIVADSEDTWDVNNLIIARNGSTIEGLADNVNCDIKGILITCVYSGTTWQLYTETNAVSGDVVSPTSTDTLTNKTIHGDTNTLTVDGTNEIGFRGLPINGEKTASYSAVSSDRGKCITVGTGGSLTIPNSTFSPGDAFTVFNNTTTDVTITCSTTTSYIGGTNENKASVALATRGLATVFFVNGTTSVISGNVS